MPFNKKKVSEQLEINKDLLLDNLTNDNIVIEEGSGNVFADLGYPDSEKALTKSRLAQRITKIIEERNLTQVQAIAILGIEQTELLKLTRGQLQEFSVDQLSHFLNTFLNP